MEIYRIRPTLIAHENENEKAFSFSEKTPYENENVPETGFHFRSNEKIDISNEKVGTIFSSNDNVKCKIAPQSVLTL